jgi:hypothetical protein
VTGEVAYGRPPHGRREDPVEFAERFFGTTRRGSGSAGSGKRLTNAIDRVTGNEP